MSPDLQSLATDGITAPHVGHLYSMVLADIFKRWQVLLGKQAILCTGTDEHGMKVNLALLIGLVERFLTVARTTGPASSEQSWHGCGSVL